ncbi:hypothetical protein SAFG77S_08176 [Streptomyces afghaniensis]
MPCFGERVRMNMSRTRRERLVVIGGGDVRGVAGRRLKGRDELEIVAFERGPLHVVLGVRHPVLGGR